MQYPDYSLHKGITTNKTMKWYQYKMDRDQSVTHNQEEEIIDKCGTSNKHH